MAMTYGFNVLVKFQGKIKICTYPLEYLPIYFRVDDSDLYFIEMISKELFPNRNLKNLDDLINTLNTSDGNRNIWNLVEVSGEEALNPDNYEQNLEL